MFNFLGSIFSQSGHAVSRGSPVCVITPNVTIQTFNSLPHPPPSTHHHHGLALNSSSYSMRPDSTSPVPGTYGKICELYMFYGPTCMTKQFITVMILNLYSPLGASLTPPPSNPSPPSSGWSQTFPAYTC